MNFRQRNKALLLFVSLVMSLALLVWVSGLWAQAQAQAVSSPLFTPLTPDEQSGLPEHDTGLPATRQQYVSLNTAVLSANLAELELHLFADTVYTAVHERTDQYPNGTAVWIGQLPDQPQSDISLSLLSGQLVGTINTGTTLYAVRPVIGNVHVIQQLESEYAPGLPPLVPSWDAVAAAHADLHDHAADFTLVPLEPDSDLFPPPPIGISDPKADDGSTIDVLVVYTPAVRQAAGGTAATQALIALAISESNSGYDNSLVNFNLRLAHSTEVAYTEVGDFVTDLERVTYFDGHIDEVLTLRDQYRADVVVLLIDSQTFCGLAWLRTSDNPAFEGLAFSVTAYQCATGYYSFAHEIGHNMGSQHDRDNSGSPPLYSYGHGYQDNTNAFRTIMAYDCPNGGCVRVNRWSNPNVNYNGRSTGIDPAAPNSAHNTLSLNNVAFSVANYRQSVPPTPTPTVTPSPTSTPTPTPTPTPLPTILATLQPDQSALFDLGSFEIGFPMGVFTDDVELLLEGLSLDMLPDGPPEGLEASQYLMQVTAVYVHSGLPAQPQPGEQYLIDVVYDDAGRNHLKEPTLGLYRWDAEAGEWVLEATSILNINTQTITASGTELTAWAVLGEGPERLFLPLVRASE